MKSRNKFVLLSVMVVSIALVAPASADAALEFKTKWGAFNGIGSPTGSVAGEFSNPRGAANDAAGNIYVADSDNDRVQKFSPTGTLLQTIGTSGDGAGELNNPLDVGVDAAGDIFVADADNYRIQVFSSAGAFVRMWGKNVDTGGGTATEVCTVAANCQQGTVGAAGGEFGYTTYLDVSPGLDEVFVLDSQQNRIQQFTKAGTFTFAFGGDVLAPNGGATAETCSVAANCLAGDSGGLGGYFNAPGGVVYDSDESLTHQYLYVADTNNNRVQRLDVLSGMTFQRTWGTNVDVGGGTGFESCVNPANCQAGAYSVDNGGFSSPYDVAFDSSVNDVYVMDSYPRIQRFSNGGTFELASAPGIGNADGQLDQAYGLTTNDTGKLYITEQNNERVQRFDSSLNFELKWGANGGLGMPIGSGPGEFYEPRGVDTDANGDVFVVDSNNSRVQRFSSDGTFKLAFGSYGVRAGQFQTPWSIAIGPSGAVYVGDESSGKIQKFTPGGVYLDTFSGFGSTGGLHRGVTSIAIDAAENIYTLDPNMQRLQKFDANGNFQWATGKDVINGGPTGPELCSDAANCNTPGGYGSQGQDGGEFNYPYGATIDTNGDVLVTDFYNNRYQRFAPNGTWIEAFGRNVDSDGGGDLETCTVSANCQTAESLPAVGSLGYPSDIEVDASGAIYVIDHNSFYLQKIVGGAFVDSIGGAGRANGQFRTPWGLAVDGAGNVFIGDTFNQRVQKLGEPAPPAPPSDTTAPSLTGIKFKPPKRFKGSLQATFTCNEACDVRGTVTVKVGKRNLRATKLTKADAGKTSKLTFKFSKTNTAKIRAALRAGKRTTAKLQLRTSDLAGNVRTVSRSARLK